jgi:MFS family permease
MSIAPKTAVRRLATARGISMTGSSAAYMALNFVIYQRTGSAVWVAAALLLTFGTTAVASPFAGALGDRFDRRKVMIASDLSGAACFLAMALASAPWLLLLFAFLSAIPDAAFFTSSSAAIPNLVGEEDLAWANGMVTVGRNAGIVVGPLLGGLLLAAFGGGAVFGANAASFVVSTAMVMTVRGRFNAERHPEDGTARQDLRAGFRFLLADRVLRFLTLAWLAIVLGLGMTMVADVALVKLFHAGSFGYGAIIASWGGGSIVGSLAGARLSARTEPIAVVAAIFVVGLTSILTGVSPWFAMILVVIFVMGVGDGVSLVAEQGIFQRRTPDAVRARVNGAFDAVVHGGMALSYIVAGPAVAGLGARGVYVVGGFISLAGVAFAVPIIRASIPSREPPAEVQTGTPLELLLP